MDHKSVLRVRMKFCSFDHFLFLCFLPHRYFSVEFSVMLSERKLCIWLSHCSLSCCAMPTSTNAPVCAKRCANQRYNSMLWCSSCTATVNHSFKLAQNSAHLKHSKLGIDVGEEPRWKRQTKFHSTIRKSLSQLQGDLVSYYVWSGKSWWNL